MDKKVLIFGESDIGRAVLELAPNGRMVPKEECDVRDIARVKEVMLRDQPDLVVNCAGVSHINSIVKSTPGEWEEELSVNLYGSYVVAKAAVETLPKTTLVFLASVAGMYGKAEHSGYSASKAGVRSLVQSLGMEGINAFSVSPGRVDTKMREKDFPGEDPKTRLTTKQVAEVILGCESGKYNPGDNLVIRKRGFRTLRRVDRGQPWRDYLAVKPIGSPKEI